MAETCIEGGWIAEEELAKNWGVPRERVRELRVKLPAADLRVAGRRIYWSLKGSLRIGLEVSLKISEKQPVRGLLLEKNPPAGGPEVLTVCSTPGPAGWHFGNHHVIRAKRASGELVIVRVVDSRKFAPKTAQGQPMCFLAVMAESGVMWRLVGREPRWPGRW